MAAIIREHYSETPIFSPLAATPALPPISDGKEHWIIETRSRELKNLRVRLLSSPFPRATWRGRQFARRYRVTVFVVWIKNEDGTRGQVVARAWLSTREKRGHQSGHHLNVAKSEWFKTPHRKKANRQKDRSSFRRQPMRVISEAKYTKIVRREDIRFF